MSIKSNLQVLRAKYRMSQTKLANVLGVTLTTYHKKEIGKREFTLSEAKKISDVFNLSVDIIFFTEIVHTNGTEPNFQTDNITS